MSLPSRHDKQEERRSLVILGLGLNVTAAICLLLVSATAGAGEQQKPALFIPNPKITGSEGYASARPDVLYRERGVKHLRSGRYVAAADAFKAAARYADKMSQTVYAELLWDGLGVEQDRPLAYAWMDLAAERGDKTLLAKRESYWSQLDEAERQHALQVGQAVYAEYGDDVAKPRQERKMRQARKHSTGSRTGAGTQNLRVYLAEDFP